MVPRWIVILAVVSLTSAEVGRHVHGNSVYFEITIDDDEETFIENSSEEEKIIENFSEEEKLLDNSVDVETLIEEAVDEETEKTLKEKEIIYNVRKRTVTPTKKVENTLLSIIAPDFDSSNHNYAKPTDQMIAEAGYPVETHTVVTPDGYILRIHRIPHAKSANKSRNDVLPLVFLQHGLLSSSADWVVTGPDHAMAYYLADNGYDVWMGNFRGNIYSQDHVDEGWKMDGKYWHFSWDQMAEYDLPTMLKHAMEITGQEKFYYIGHSMGTLSYYTACNYHPWIPAATKLMVGYGAHTVVQHMTSPVRLVAPFAMDVQWLMEHLGMYQFKPSLLLTEWFASIACSQDMENKHLCKEVIFLIYGYNKNEMNSTDLPYIMCHVGGTSTQAMIHYAQSVNQGGWRGFDWGSDEDNLVHWNNTSPPEYKYDGIKVPVALFWGQNDWLVDPKDEGFLARKLPNLVMNTRVADDDYTHTDFIWGIHSVDLVYKPTIDLMKKYMTNIP